MTALKVLAVLIVVLALIGCIRFGAAVEYSSEGVTLWAKVLWLRIKLYPRPEKTPEQERAEAEKQRKKAEKAKKKEEKRREKAAKAKERAEKRAAARSSKAAQKPPKSPEEAPPKRGGRLDLVLKLIPPGLEALGRLKNALRFDELRLHYTVPGRNDPAGAAMLYGELCATGGAVTALLENQLNIKKREISAWVDFTAAEALVYLRLTITLTVGQLVVIFVRFGTQFLRIYLAQRREKEHKSVQEGK